jgi:hypothetical protein
MRAKLSAALAVLAATVLAATPAAAITNGTPDGNDHPYVGVIVFYGATGAPVGRCSGEALSNHVFLTSGHCITLNHGVTAEVWFQEHATTTPGTGFASSGALLVSPDGELGAMNAVASFNLPRFATKPAQGVVDTLANKSPLLIVGYGVTEQDKISGNPIGRWNQTPTDRTEATSALVSGTQSGSESLLKHQNGPGGDSGGGCFHDSGGPIVQPGSDAVLAINAFVNNANCTGVGYGSRLDTAAHLAWIDALLQ